MKKNFFSYSVLGITALSCAGAMVSCGKNESSPSTTAAPPAAPAAPEAPANPQAPAAEPLITPETLAALEAQKYWKLTTGQVVETRRAVRSGGSLGDSYLLDDTLTTTGNLDFSAQPSEVFVASSLAEQTNTTVAQVTRNIEPPLNVVATFQDNIMSVCVAPDPDAGDAFYYFGEVLFEYFNFNQERFVSKTSSALLSDAWELPSALPMFLLKYFFDTNTASTTYVEGALYELSDSSVQAVRSPTFEEGDEAFTAQNFVSEAFPSNENSRREFFKFMKLIKMNGSNAEVSFDFPDFRAPGFSVGNVGCLGFCNVGFENRSLVVAGSGFPSGPGGTFDFSQTVNTTATFTLVPATEEDANNCLGTQSTQTTSY